MNATSKFERKKTCPETKENVINRKFIAFFIEYEIYFTHEKGSYLIFFTLENI